MGGWLGLFMFAIAVASPLQVVISGYQNLYADPLCPGRLRRGLGTLVIGEWILMALDHCRLLVHRLAADAGRALVHRQNHHRRDLDPRARRAAARTVAGLGVPGISMSLLLGETAADLGQPTVFGIIWTLYFLNSKRVANTYVKDDDAEVSKSSSDARRPARCFHYSSVTAEWPAPPSLDASPRIPMFPFDLLQREGVEDAAFAVSCGARAGRGARACRG